MLSLVLEDDRSLAVPWHVNLPSNEALSPKMTWVPAAMVSSLVKLTVPTFRIFLPSMLACVELPSKLAADASESICNSKLPLAASRLVALTSSFATATPSN